MSAQVRTKIRLSRSPNNVECGEEIAEKFGDVGESRFLVIAKLIDDFLGRLGDGERRYLLGQLGQFFASYDRPDLAERLKAS